MDFIWLIFISVLNALFGDSSKSQKEEDERKPASDEAWLCGIAHKQREKKYLPNVG